MTESEAIEILEAYMECYRRKTEVDYEKQCHENCDVCNLCYAQGTVGEHKEAVKMAINALEENQQYKELGTFEELRIAKEKQIAKKPMVSYDERVKEYWCSCGVCCFGLGWKRAINHKYKYCLDCGQAIDWSDEE